MFDKACLPGEKSAGCPARRRGWLGVSLLLILLGVASARAGALQVLRGHVPAEAAGLRAEQQLEATNVLRLAIGLPLRNQAELDKLLEGLYDPTSPNFRHFLAADEFAQRFGPTEQDYRAVMAFAASNNLVVTAQHSNRVLVDVAGSVADIERAFHLKMQVYAHPTEPREFYAPDGEPQLDLAVPVLHISGLDNYTTPRPCYRELTAAMRAAAQASPEAGSGPSGYYEGGDFRAAYVPGVTNTGAGQSVGLVEFNSGYAASDIQAYEASNALPNVTLNNVLLDGIASITSNDTGPETPLDIEMAISMAPGMAKVIVYDGSMADDILSSMATANAAKQLSASWTFSVDATTLQLFQQFAAQGQSYFNSSGDTDAYNTSVPSPVDAPYITTVGGTSLTTSGPGGAWVAENAWNRGDGVGSSGGISPTYSIPLWQQGINMDASQGSEFMRNIPDVAMAAENIWVLYGNGNSESLGGTSCAAPLWAGFMALVNQQAAVNSQPPVGFVNPAIYALGKSANYSASFHDITAGNNTWSGSPDRYFAAAGYDLCTGWGTPTGQSLINALALAPFNPLVVTPTNGFNLAGPKGGPLTPATNIFTLANYGINSLSWSLASTSTWFTISPTSGSLTNGAMTNVKVTVATAANSLAHGYYTANVFFTNKSNSLVFSRPLTLAVGTGLKWDSTAGGGTPKDGEGVWADTNTMAGGTNWYTGTKDVYWTNASPDWAIFGVNSGAAGTVTLGSDIVASGVDFAKTGSGSYTIAGGGNVLTLNGNILVSNSATVNAPVALGVSGIFNTATNETLTVSGLLSGASGNNLTLTGNGTVTLTGQNNTGPSSGMAGTVTVSSGTLSLDGGGSLYGVLGNSGGITVDAGATLTLLDNNDISGADGIPVNITLNGGALNDTGLSQPVGDLTLNGGTVSGTGSSTGGSYNLNGDCIVSANTTLAAQNVTAAANSTFYVNGASTLTFSGTMTGGSALNFAGPGAMLVTGTNNYTGGTMISGGTLQLGNGGAGGGLGSGPVVNSGLLEFNRSDDFTWTNTVGDPQETGTFVKTNSDTVTLPASTAFLSPNDGTVQINGGTLLIIAPGVLDCGGGYWLGENSTASNIIAGGTLIVSNELAVGRNNSNALGVLTLNSGTIEMGAFSGFITVGALGATGTMTVNGGSVSNAPAIFLGESSTGKGTLNLNGGLVQAGQIARAASPGATAILNLNGGTLQATGNQAVFVAIDQVNVQAGNAIIDDGGNDIGINQPLLDGGGGGGLVKNGGGTLTLTGTCTYTGPTTVNSGTLKLGPDPVLHFSFDNIRNGMVINDGTGGAGMDGVLPGSGAAIVSGGRYGNALSFNGTLAFVLVSDPVTRMDCNPGGASWTYAAWIKTATAGAAYGYQGNGFWNATGQTSFYLNNNTKNAGGTKAGGLRKGDNWLTGTTTLNDNNWHFVAITVNAGTKTIYADGAVDAQTGTTGWVAAGSTNASEFWIGATPDSSDGEVNMNGLMDEVYVFARAISQSEVQSLMTYNSLGSHQVLPPATALTLAANATLDMSSLSQTIGSLSGAGGSTVLLANGTNNSALTFGNASNTVFGGTITGNGSVTKNGSGSTTLSGVNTFNGVTTINAGRLLVNGSLGTSSVTVAGGTLGGTGVIAGPTSILPGAAVTTDPASIGTLTFDAGLAFAAGSTNVMKLNKALQTNDQLVVAGVLGFGGTLVVTNLTGTLAAGDNFPLFNAGSYSGSFAGISPATPGPGLTWNTSTLATDGTLRVVAAGPPDFGSFGVFGTNFVFSAVDGPPGSQFRVLTSTNLLLPLTNWTPVWTNVFDVNGNGPPLTNAVDPTVPQQFFEILVP